MILRSATTIYVIISIHITPYSPQVQVIKVSIGTSPCIDIASKTFTHSIVVYGPGSIGSCFLVVSLTHIVVFMIKGHNIVFFFMAELCTDKMNIPWKYQSSLISKVFYAQLLYNEINISHNSNCSYNRHNAMKYDIIMTLLWHLPLHFKATQSLNEISRFMKWRQ